MAKWEYSKHKEWDGVYPITPEKDIKNDVLFQIGVKKPEHTERFYLWVEGVLSINKIDTDEKIKLMFLEKMSEEEADFYLGQRKRAFKEGSEFKLMRFEGRRVSNKEFSNKVLSGISERNKRIGGLKR